MGQTMRAIAWLAGAAILFNEVLYFAVTCSCNWPNLPEGTSDSDDVIRLLVVSDMHLLGYRRRLHIERTWVDWQMRKAFAFSRWGLDKAPTAVVFLGDMVDEGGSYTSDAAYRQYAERYATVFRLQGRAAATWAVTSSGTSGDGGDARDSAVGSSSGLGEPHVHVVGNHDTAFGAHLQLRLVRRFERAYGAAHSLTALSRSGTVLATARFGVDALLAQSRSSKPPRDGKDRDSRDDQDAVLSAEVGRVIAAPGAALLLMSIDAQALSAHDAERPRGGDVARYAAAARQLVETVGAVVAAQPPRRRPPLALLTHMPLYRPDDRRCGPERARERGHVTYEAPDHPHRIGWDVLSPGTSRWLIRTLTPSVVLSGHTHTSCRHAHVNAGAGAGAGDGAESRHSNADAYSAAKQWEGNGTWAQALPGTRDASTARVALPVAVPEFTASSFSWGMRPDPSFALVVIATAEGDNGGARRVRASVRTCALPYEPVVFAVYGAAVTLIALSALVRCASRCARAPSAAARQHPKPLKQR